MSNSVSVAKRRRNLKKLIVEMMGGRCHRCGWFEHVAGLQAHHANPKDKEFALSTKGITRSWDAVKKEARKCFLLCANCHAVVHITNDTFYMDESNLPFYPDLVEPARELMPPPECEKCGGKKSSRRFKLCQACNTKIEWPPVQDILDAVADTSYTGVAKELGVSDNAVRKFLKSNGIEPPRKHNKV